LGWGGAPLDSFPVRTRRFSNQSTELHGWRYFNLGFSKALLRVSRIIAKSYSRGTMIRLMPN